MAYTTLRIHFKEKYANNILNQTNTLKMAKANAKLKKYYEPIQSRRE